MKYIFAFFVFFLSSFLFFGWVSAECSIPTNESNSTSPVDFLKWCSADSADKAVLPSVSEGQAWVKELVIKMASRLIQFGALFAIGVIVYSGIRYTTSVWDDEKIKNAKGTLIYAVIWLILLLIAFPLVDIIIGFIYSFG